MNIRTKFAVALIVLGIIAAIVNVALISIGSSEMQGTITDGVALAAKESVHSLEVSIKKDISYLQTYGKTLADSPVLEQSNQRFDGMENVQQYIDGTDREWRQASEGSTLVRNVLDNDLSRTLQTREQYDTVFSEVIVTNRYGAVVGATGKTTDYRQDDEEWWQQAREDGLYLDYRFDESVNTWGIEIALPLTGDNNTFQGVMSALLPMDTIGETISDSQRTAGIIQSVDLVASDGTVLYSTGHHERGDDISGHSMFQQATGADGSFITRTHDGGGKTLYAYAETGLSDTLDGFDWVLFIEYDPTTVLQPLETLRDRFFISTVLLILIALAGLWLIVNSFLNPVQDITKTITSISTGELDRDIPDEAKDRDDEVGELARAFDRTLTSLKLAMKRTAPELQEKVAEKEESRERTVALLESALDATQDGLLIVDTEGNIIQYNQAFIDIWELPEEVAESGDDERALAAAVEKVKDPESFREKVEYLYDHPEEESFDVIEFKDGSIIERYSKPYTLHDDIVGRVWSFRDVTDEHGEEDG